MKVCKSGQFCENINFSVNTKQRGVLAEQMFTKSLVHFAHHHCHRHWSSFLCQLNYKIMTMLSHSAISLQPIDACMHFCPHHGHRHDCHRWQREWSWLLLLFAMNTRAIGNVTLSHTEPVQIHNWFLLSFHFLATAESQIILIWINAVWFSGQSKACLFFHQS